MIRKDSPKLKAEIAAFAKQYGEKSAFGNELIKKYGDGNPRIVKQATSAGEIKKFKKTVEYFRKYGAQYDMDYLLMVAQGYQESLLDQNAQKRRRRDRRDATDACHRQGDEDRRHDAA